MAETPLSHLGTVRFWRAPLAMPADSNAAGAAVAKAEKDAPDIILLDATMDAEGFDVAYGLHGDPKSAMIPAVVLVDQREDRQPLRRRVCSRPWNRGKDWLMTIEGRKILIVDDNEDARDAMQVVLEANGCLCVTAVDGEDGLAKARSERPDLIILDIQMPRKDGFQTFGELRGGEATKAIPVIMLTGVGERVGIRFSAREMGEYLGSEPEAYLEKPVDPEKVVATVSRVLGAG